jgi:nucleoside-diphosphate-sugar epimerase
MELLLAVESATGRPIARRFESPRVFDPHEVILDASLASKTFDWAPKVDLEEGIALTARAAA